jgi:DNA-binding XRE family transcriptional regulator
MTNMNATRTGRPTLAAVDGPAQLDPTQVDQEWLRTVGMRVLLARTARRESQEELGRRAGVSRVSVGSIERADHPASVLAFARLAAALDLRLGELLDGYGSSFSGDGSGVCGDRA